MFVECSSKEVSTLSDEKNKILSEIWLLRDTILSVITSKVSSTQKVFAFILKLF